MPIVKKAAKVTDSKTVTKASAIGSKQPVLPAKGQRFLQFYYSISVAGDPNGPDIRKFNGSVPIGPVGGPPHFPEWILHPITEDLHAKLTFQAPDAE